MIHLRFTLLFSSPCGYGVVEYARQLSVRVVKGDKAVWDHLRKAMGFKSERERERERERETQGARRKWFIVWPVAFTI